MLFEWKNIYAVLLWLILVYTLLLLLIACDWWYVILFICNLILSVLLLELYMDMSLRAYILTIPAST